MFSNFFYRVEGIKLKQSFLTSPLGVRFSRNHFLYKKTDEVTQRLTSAGIMKNLWNDFHNQFKPIPKDIKEPKVLNVDDLRFGFIIWLVACGISSSVFLSEIIICIMRKLWKLLKKMLQKFLGLIFFLKLLKWKVENH
jgi:hypothetical protein